MSSDTRPTQDGRQIQSPIAGLPEGEAFNPERIKRLS
jgi:hypothetical protein